MRKHSPTPWKRGTDGVIFDADNEYVTDTCSTSLPEGEDNQKLIVRAVNCHENLLAACKGLLAFIEPKLSAEGGIAGCCPESPCVACVARAAITKAGDRFRLPARGRAGRQGLRGGK